MSTRKIKLTFRKLCFFKVHFQHEKKTYLFICEHWKRVYFDFNNNNNRESGSDKRKNKNWE